MSKTPKEQEYREVLKNYNLDYRDFQRIEKIFQKNGISIIIERVQKEGQSEGRPYMIFKKGEQIVSLDAGLFGQCLGFIFFDEKESWDDSKKTQKRLESSTKKLREIKKLKSGEFFMFNIDIFDELVKKLLQQELVKVMSISDAELGYYNSLLTEYQATLSLEFIGNNPILIVSDVVSGLPKYLDSETNHNVLGFIFKNPIETKDGFVSRKNYLEEKYRGEFLEYSKESLERYLKSFLAKKKTIVRFKDKITSGKAIAELYLSSKNFVEKNFSNFVKVSDNFKKDEKSFPKIDFLFSNKDKIDFQLEYLNLSFVDYDNNKNTKKIEINNVCGLILVDNSLSSQDIKKTENDALAQLRAYYPVMPQARILALTTELLQLWKSSGLTINKSPKINSRYLELSQNQKNINLNKIAGPTKIGVHVYEPEKSHIGGTQLTMKVDYGENYSENIILDRGWIFDLAVNSSQRSSASYSDGLNGYLSNSMWALQKNVFRTDLLVQSVNPEVLNSLVNIKKEDNPDVFASVEEFIGLELYQRFGFDGLMSILEEKTPYYFAQLRKKGKLSNNSFVTNLKERASRVYRKVEKNLVALFSHAHQDHAIGSAFLRDEIVRGWSPITRAFLLGDYKNSSDWYVQETAVRKLREEGKVGSAFPVYEYPYIPFLGSGEKIQVSDNVYISALDVEHSIPGSLAFRVDVLQNNQRLSSVVYPGDYKNPGIFSKLKEMGAIDLLFVEGTNPPNVHKDSAHFTETLVKDNFAKVMTEVNVSNKLLIIDLVKNNTERLANLLEEAYLHGRTVVISPKIVQRCQGLELIQKVLSEKYKLKMPNFSLPNIKIWKREMSEYGREHSEMFAQYGAVDIDMLSKNPTQYILIRDSNENIEKIMGISAPAVWIRSIYGDYDFEAKQRTSYYQRRADEKGWSMRREGFHATGHGPLTYSSNDPKKSGILANLHKSEAKKYAIIHTEDRGRVHKTMMSYPNLQDKEVVHQITHKKELGSLGHYIKLFGE